MKRILGSLFVLLLAVLLLPGTANAAAIVDSGTCGESVTWTLDSEGTLTISGAGAMYDYPNNELPPYYAYNDRIQKIIIQDGVTVLGIYAFWQCRNVTEVRISESVISIEMGAFYACSSLSNVEIPGSVTNIRESAFNSCASLTSVEIPDGVTCIGSRTFYNCTSLSSVEIPDTVTSIDDYAFSGCISLRTVKIPSNVINIGKSAFSGCISLGCVEIPNNVINIGESAFRSCTSLRSVEIPDSVTQIGKYAFSGCTSLKGVVLSDNVGYIEEGTFEGCISLTDMDIPASVTIIGTGAFWNCASLVNVRIPDSVIKLGWNSFADCISLTSVIIPDSVTYIGGYSFQNCIRLSRVEISDGVTSIRDNTFYGCEELSSVEIPDGVTEIGESAFEKCTSLRSVEIPSSVTRMEALAFFDCEGLTEIRFQGDAPEITSSCFRNVTATVYYPDGNRTWTPENMYLCQGELVWTAGNPACTHSQTRIAHAKEPDCIKAGYTGDYVCADCGEEIIEGKSISAKGHIYERGKCTICGKDETVADIIDSGVCGDSLTWTLDEEGLLVISGTGSMWPYSISNIYYDYDDYNDDYDNVFSYEDYVIEKKTSPFYKRRDKICCVIVENGVTCIGVDAFNGCSSLVEVILCNNLTSIESGAFANCTSLSSIKIPNSVTSIVSDTFADCISLNKVEIPDSVTSVGSDAFKGCASMSSVEIPDSVTNIGSGTFADCISLNKVEIPDSVTSIGSDAFKGCTSLSSVEIPGSVTSIESWAFKGCISLGRVEIPDSVTSIGRDAFYECANLHSVDILSTEISIGRSAFSRCFTMKEIHFRGNAPAIPQNCFTYVMATAYYPANNPTWTEEVMQDYGGTITWVAEEPAPEEPDRAAGENRFETAAVAADQIKKNLGIEKFDTVVVASGMDFADALSGSYLAAVNNAPILLACQVEKYNNEVKDYILENLNQGGKIYILGGENAVPASFETGLDGFKVERLAGSNRFETNLLVLEKAGVGDKPILVSTGLNFADSLSASAAKLPILLVYGDKLLDSQRTFLEANQGKNICILGGTGAVSEKLETQLNTLGTVERLAGANRFETSVMIAEKFFQNPESAVLAYAWNFPDGLCGGPLAATMGAPLILTMEKYETQAASYIQGQSIKTGIILGGEKLIPNSSVNTIFAMK